MSTPYFHLACLDRNADAVLIYAHKLPNRFATKAEAHRVAREVLHSERYTVWYATSQGRQRAVATVDTRTAAVSL